MDNGPQRQDEEARPGDLDLKIEGDVSGEVHVAGRDVISTRTIIQQLPMPVLLGGLGVLIAGLVTIALILSSGARRIGGVVEDVGQDMGAIVGALDAPTLTPAPTPTITPTPLPFPVAEPGEILVIVTDFTGEGVEADTRIFRELRNRVADSGLEHVRVERLEGAAPVLAEEAVAIGQRFGATLVIWGTADTLGIEPYYEVVRHDKIVKNQIEMSSTAYVDLASFSLYVRRGLPDDFEYLMLFTLGQIAFFGNDYEKALVLFDQTLAIDLGDRVSDLAVFIPYYYRAKVNVILSNEQAALDDFDRAIQLNPGLGPAYVGRGLMYEILGDSDAALADYARSIELNPHNAVAAFNAGNIYLKQGDYQAAVERYTLAIEAAPSEQWDFYYNRARAYERGGDAEAAEADYRHALDVLTANIEGGSEDFDSYYYRGWLFLTLDDPQAAIDDFTRAAEIEPEEAAVYELRAWAYTLLGDYEAAIADLSRVIVLDPESASAFYNRAYLVALFGGDLEGALSDVERALLLDPDNAPKYYNTRGLVYYRLGEYQAALEDFNRALELGEDFAYYGRGLVYEALGQTWDALNDLTRFVELHPDANPQSDDALQHIEALGRP
jgi:tetratricopeptide (TPR) repeat protein